MAASASPYPESQGVDLDPVTWRRPGALIRRWLYTVRRSRAERTVDYDFAEMSINAYVGTIAPDLAEAPDKLRRRVTEMARAEALDEGSGHVFDATIDSWVEQWCNRIDAEHHARQSVLQQREEIAAAHIERNRQLVQWVERQLAEVDQEIDRLEAEPPRQRGGARRRRRLDVPQQRPDSH
jgi:hypothetical protein